MITKVKYTDLTSTQVKITLDDGREMVAGVKGATWLHTVLREWLQNGGIVEPYAPPPAPTVTSVTPRQAKLALLSAGLLDDVEAAIDAIADPATKRAAQIEWEYAQEIKRDWPLLVQLATSMGMTESDLDELFTQAALL